MTDLDRREARCQQLLTALSTPLRRKILRELAGTTELSPQECSKRLKEHLSNVGYHFRELAKCDAIALARTEQVRGTTKHYYRFAIKERWALEALGLPSPLKPT
jgi:DNA-binding transcriptional ArsR family regulator